MELHEALDQLAKHIGMGRDFIYSYAQEDTIGGWNPDVSEGRWPCGSIFGVEGKFLYSAVRALKPHRCVEIGTYHGCSATHISSALARNGHGRLYCVDPSALADVSGPQVDMIHNSIFDWTPIAPIDFIFEDGPHSREFTRDALRHLSNHMAASCMIMVHDYEHYVVGADVSASFDEYLGHKPHVALIEPSDCGIAYWQKEKA